MVAEDQFPIRKAHIGKKLDQPILVKVLSANFLDCSTIPILDFGISPAVLFVTYLPVEHIIGA